MKELIFSLFVRIATYLSGMRLRRIPGTYFIYRFIYRTLAFPGIVLDIQGHKMFLDSKDALELSVHGVHELFTTEVIKREVKKGDTVLDIGANIGYYTLIMSKIVGMDGEVIAFEPEPTNYDLLGKNAEVNTYSKITLYQCAVSDKNGLTNLYLHKLAPEHRMCNPSGKHKSIKVQSGRLDDLSLPKKIDFIKMDIEGAEGRAIEGMSQILQRNKNLKIVMEISPNLLKDFGDDAFRLLSKLISYGFQVDLINEASKCVELRTIIEIIKIAKRQKGINLFIHK